jgi:hypothetical protein
LLSPSLSNINIRTWYSKLKLEIISFA